MARRAFSALRWLNDSNSTSRRRSTLSAVGRMHVADELQVPHGVQAVRLAGIARHEHQIVLLQARRIPLQIVRHFGRLAVLVDAEEADVEIVAGILEIVGVAAEEGDVLLGAKTSRTSVYFL